MKCIECQGTGLKDQNNLCPICNGSGEVAEMVNSNINSKVEDIKHTITKEDIKVNGLEGQVEVGEEIIIPAEAIVEKPKKAKKK